MDDLTSRLTINLLLNDNYITKRFNSIFLFIKIITNNKE